MIAIQLDATNQGDIGQLRHVKRFLQVAVVQAIDSVRRKQCSLAEDGAVSVVVGIVCITVAQAFFIAACPDP